MARHVTYRSQQSIFSKIADIANITVLHLGNLLCQIDNLVHGLLQFVEMFL